jgi:predicted membrane protein
MNEQERGNGERGSPCFRLAIGQHAGGEHSGLLVGVVIIALGVILLLDQEGIVRAWDLWRFWPIILIVAGLMRVYRAATVPDRLWGLVEILFGVVFQLGALGYQHFRFAHTWPLLVVGVGLWVLYKAFKEEQPTTVESSLDFNRVDVFGGGKVRVTSKKFRRGRWLAVFGGSQVDFSEVDIEGDQATLEIVAVFGGGEMVVPQNWEVQVRTATLFGGHNDETRRPLQETAGARKILVIRGVMIFGGFSLKN